MEKNYYMYYYGQEQGRLNLHEYYTGHTHNSRQPDPTQIPFGKRVVWLVVSQRPLPQCLLQTQDGSDNTKSTQLIVQTCSLGQLVPSESLIVDMFGVVMHRSRHMQLTGAVRSQGQSYSVAETWGVLSYIAQWCTAPTLLKPCISSNYYILILFITSSIVGVVLSLNGQNRGNKIINKQNKTVG